jgi:alginate O-acetyltransferase complex protein AlgI
VLFNSLIFLLIFLPVTYVVFWSLRSATSRYVWLTITGYVFYGYWDARFCLLMAFSTMVSYVAGLGFLRFHSGLARKVCLVAPITVDLLLLGFFKYVDFFLGSIDGLAQYLDWGKLPVRLSVILPIGISFYTFHTISYIVDSYRGTIKPTRNFFEFAAYVSLFSQLVAGPIVRFGQIEEDLERLGAADRTRWLSLGISFFVFGLVEKVLLADCLAAVVDPLWADRQRLSTSAAWLAVLGYSFQLYFDFSGYSTMAVGLGYMFGIRIPQNFNSPYKALDPSDFWRRWHISLSTCMRDYLYIPMGGNRCGPVRTQVNLLLTMLIGGLWHGANWTFIVWGGYHGLLLIGHRLLAPAWDVLPAVFRRAGMFFFAVMGWVFFRAESIDAARDMFGRMFTATEGAVCSPLEDGALLVAIAAAWAMLGPNSFDWHERGVWRRAAPYGVALAFGICFAIILGGRSSPFLYFQF